MRIYFKEENGILYEIYGMPLFFALVRLMPSPVNAAAARRSAVTHVCRSWCIKTHEPATVPVSLVGRAA